MEKETNTIVKKANTLIEAHYQLGINEQKIMYKLISLIRMDDEDFKTYEIKMTDLISFLDAGKTKSIYQDIVNYNSSLRKCDITFTDKDGNLVLTGWFSSATHDKEKGTIIYEFSQKLKPYLLELKEKHFTQFHIKNIMKFNCKYSFRIYELLSQYKNSKYKKREIKIDKLRKILVLGNMYKEYKNFKNRILLVGVCVVMGRKIHLDILKFSKC